MRAGEEKTESGRRVVRRSFNDSAVQLMRTIQPVQRLRSVKSSQRFESCKSSKSPEGNFNAYTHRTPFHISGISERSKRSDNIHLVAAVPIVLLNRRKPEYVRDRFNNSTDKKFNRPHGTNRKLGRGSRLPQSGGLTVQKFTPVRRHLPRFGNSRNVEINRLFKA